MLIKIENLSYAYNGTPVLRDISVSIDKGERWAILGKNGAGKSTLLKCIGRLIEIPHNKISIRNKKLEEYSSINLAHILSYVPQASNRSVPPFSVYDFVMMGRFPYQGFMATPSPADRAIVTESLELTDTTQLADRLMPSLSGGELQRVFLAGAVAQRTDVILLDEPITFLDPLHQEMVRQCLNRIHSQFGTTFITVTHDINAALSNSSHVLAILNGTVNFSGPIQKFLEECPGILKDIYSIEFESVEIDSGIGKIMISLEIQK